MYEEVNRAIIGSGNGLSPVCVCQAITCTIQYTLKKGLNEIRIKLQSFFVFFQENIFENVIWKLWSIPCVPTCLSLFQGPVSI